MTRHQMQYRAGSSGLGHLGIPDGPAYWFCPCQEWAFMATRMSNRETGNNRIEAVQDFRIHLNQQPDPYGVVDSE